MLASSLTSTPSPLSPRLPSPVSGGLSWFCLRAAGRREHLAATNLTRRNAIEAFAPRIRVRQEVRSGGGRTITEALFPGYLFARFSYPEQLRHVVSATDVLGLVTFGGPPPRVDETTVEHLRQHATPDAGTPLSPVFAAGDWVRVIAGGLRGTEGRVCTGAAGRDRVCVLLCLLGHDVEISVPGDQLLGRVDQPKRLPAALRVAPEPTLVRPR